MEELAVTGRRAWARVIERAVLTPRAPDAPIHVSGATLAVLARTGAGRLVARDVGSLDHPG